MANATLNGTETLQVLAISANGSPAATTQTTTTQAIANLSAAGGASTIVTSIATVGAGTLTAAAIVGKVISRAGSQSATPFTDTTDIASAIITALGASAVIGESFQLTYDNTTNATATITGGTGVTVSVITVIPQNSFVRYLATYSAAGTVTMVGIESGTLANPVSIASGKTLAASNTLTLAGTDGTTMTFPSTSATVARTDAANTFTGTQTVGALVVSQVTQAPVAGGATITVTAASHAGTTIRLDTASGTVATLPAATGTGNKYRFVVTVSATSNKHAILAVGSDKLIGNCYGIRTTTITPFLALIGSAFQSLQMPFAGTQPSGGIEGDWFELEDVASGLWETKGGFSAGTTATTPYSTATS